MSGRNSKCWEAGWVWVMQWIFIFFFLKLCETDAATSQLRNLSRDRYRKDDPRARSWLFFAGSGMRTGVEERVMPFLWGQRVSSHWQLPFSVRWTKPSSSVLSLAQGGCNLIEWHLRGVMARHDEVNYWLLPNSLQGFTDLWQILTPGLPIPAFLAVIFLKYSLLVTIWIPCNS